MKKKTLLIDLDGTLLGSKPRAARWRFIVYLLAYFLFKGLNPIPRIKAVKGFRAQLESGFANKKGTSNFHFLVSEYSQATKLPIAAAETELRAALNYVFAKMRPAFFGKPESLVFLEWAIGRFNLVLATNPAWPLEIVKTRLDWGQIDPKAFSFISHAENMSYCKPNPNYYRELLTQINIPAEECLMIGDDRRKDLPAQEANIEVYIISDENCGFADLKERLT